MENLKRKRNDEDSLLRDADLSDVASSSSKVAAATEEAECSTSSSSKVAAATEEVEEKTTSMKVFIVECIPFFQLTAHSSLEKATAFSAANENSTIMKNASTKVPKGQNYFEVEGIALGDTVYAPLYYSDMTDKSYVGGVFQSAEKMRDELGRTKKWRMSPMEKNGSGELYERDMVVA